MSTQCQSDVNTLPIPFQSSVNALTNRCQSIFQSNDDKLPICQSNHKPMPIQCQSCVDPTPFNSYQSNPVPIRSQSDTNSVPIQFHQFNANLPIHSNLPIHHQSTNILPILGQSANPSPSCQTITNHTIRCISWTNLQIHHRSDNPMPVLDQSINLTQIQKYKTNPMPICQSNANIQPIQK